MPPPGPGSLTWRLVGDWRGLLCGGRALLLQVAHPVVGAGVAEHSDFRADPWSRLARTLTSTMTFAYGGPVGAPAEADRLRALHRTIRGTDERGRRYHALDPEAYAWVHLTLFETTLVVQERFGRALSPADQRRLYAEWLAAGRLLGLREGQVPPDLAAFRRYYDRMLADRLEDNRSVRDVLAALADPARPPWWPGPAALWRPAGAAGGRLNTLVTVGTLPPVLRDRLGLAWSARDERRLARFAALVRAVAPRVPGRLRHHPIAWRAIRAAAGGPTAGRGARPD